LKDKSIVRDFKTRLPEVSYKKAKSLVLLKEDGHIVKILVNKYFY